jgi:uncharacterized caspase-like protein
MKKLALVVGINYYGTSRQLGGCLNDAEKITEKLIEEFGFDLKDIQLLVEEFATRQNILDGIQRLIRELSAGDLGVFTYAGHGTQTVDLPPIEEPDMLDEAIVPYDAVNNRENLIRDDEIGAKLAQLVTDSHFVVIFDSCHSATATRMQPEILNNLLFSQSKAEEKPRLILPDLPVNRIQMIINNIAANINIDTSKTTTKRHPLEGKNHILIAACAADGLAYEDGIHGYFTDELLKLLKKEMTYQELYAKVHEKVMLRTGNRQKPHIEGPLLTRKVFAEN